jgi:hypothetical protein
MVAEGDLNKLFELDKNYSGAISGHTISRAKTYNHL